MNRAWEDKLHFTKALFLHNKCEILIIYKKGTWIHFHWNLVILSVILRPQAVTNSWKALTDNAKIHFHSWNIVIMFWETIRCHNVLRDTSLNNVLRGASLSQIVLSDTSRTDYYTICFKFQFLTFNSHLLTNSHCMVWTYRGHWRCFCTKPGELTEQNQACNRLLIQVTKHLLFHIWN